MSGVFESVSAPAEWPGQFQLADGREVRIRPLERGDRAELAAAVGRLSDRSRYFRFASAKPRLSSRELDALTDVDHHLREAFVAFDVRTRQGVAVGRAAAIPGDKGAVELAITVDDGWQRQGLGTFLLAILLGRARSEGFKVARATVLAENAASRAMLHDAGFAVRTRSGILLELERRLGDG